MFLFLFIVTNLGIKLSVPFNVKHATAAARKLPESELVTKQDITIAC
jgi:hypothetical protein